MSNKPTAPGYANLEKFQAGLEENDVEMALMSGIGNFAVCAKCHSEKVDMPDGTLMCSHCNAVVGRCESCNKSRPVFQKICEQCRVEALDAAERVRKWGERRGKALTCLKRHCGDAGKCIAVVALVAMAISMLIPLLYEVNHLVRMGTKMADDVEGGIEPVLTQAGRILGYTGRNAAGALRLLETPLNITETALIDATSLVSKILAAVANPQAAFLAYNRVTGTTIICDDGTEYSWKPVVAPSGVVINPYSRCVLHQTKLNDETKAKFFPARAPKAGDPIGEEHFVPLPHATQTMADAYYHVDGNSIGGNSNEPRRDNRTRTNETGK